MTRSILRPLLLAAVVATGLISSPVFAKPLPKLPTPPVWVPTWYAAPEGSGKADIQISDQTLRQIIRISAGGTSVRVRLSNAYGTAPVYLENVHVARRVSGGRIDPAFDTAVTFNGHPGVTIAAGAYALSDPMPLKVLDDTDLAVSLYVPGPAPLATVHDLQRTALYVAPGKMSDAVELTEAKVDLGIDRAFPWIAGVDVSGGQISGKPTKSTVIAFGDSITDGAGILPDGGKTWPDTLSRHLHTAGIPLSVANAGIGGNRLWHNGQWIRFGDAALARFDRDVLAQPNVSAVVVLIGINDLGHAQGPGSPEYVSAQDMIDGLSQLAARAHEHGLRVYAGTLTPFKDTVFKGYYSDEKEDRRQTINAWIRSTPLFEGVFDFDKAVEDPNAPGHLRPDFDTGDHLHPNAAGADAMAGAIPLKAFDWAK